MAVALVVALVAATTVALRERRDRRDLEARVARLESQNATADLPADAERDAGGEGGAADPFASLLERLTGGGGLGDLAGGDLLGECADAFSGALGGQGLGALFGGGGGGDDAATAEQQVADIIKAVEEVRGLRFTKAPTPVFLSPDALKDRVRRSVDAELPDDVARTESRVLIALGALPPGSNLKALILQALGDQVVGFYDTRTGELVVAESGGRGRLGGQARIILSHELDHALTDQTLGLPVGDGRPPAGTEDAALAGLTLVEGDATLLMQLYGLGHVPLTEQLGGISAALVAQEQLARLPQFIQRQLTFPYLQGLSFACGLHGQGGWKAVDAAYRDPPTTTAQVLFPERYTAREAAADAPDPASPGAGWDPAAPQAFGAAHLLWLFEAPGGETERALDDALDKVAAWGGGELRSWSRGDQTAVGVSVAPRSGRAQALCDTMAAWYRAAFPEDRAVDARPGEELAVDGARQDAVVRCRTGGDAPAVVVGIGPDLATARSVAAAAG